METSPLEQILGKITADEKKKFDSVLDYLKPAKQLDLMVKGFEGYAGGAEDLAAEIYGNVKRYSQEKGLVDKKDHGSMADVLEQFIIAALEKMPSEDARFQAAIYKARLAAGEFGSADERLKSLIGYAQKYLGIEQKAVGGFLNAMKIGDPAQFYAGLRQLSDALAQGAVSATTAHKFEKATLGREFAFNAYAIQRLREDYKLEPRKPLEALETGSALADLRKLWSKKDDDLGLVPYKPA